MASEMIKISLDQVTRLGLEFDYTICWAKPTRRLPQNKK